MILQRAGDHFRRAGRAAIYQYHHRGAITGITRGGLVVHFGVFQPPLGVDYRATVEEQARHIYTGAQYAAGVVAQIQHQPF